MPNTPLGIPYPLLTDAPNSPSQMASLASYIDGLFTTRDTAVASRAVTAAARLTQTRAWSAADRAGTSDNFSATTRTQLQTVTFTGPSGTYQIVSRQSISAGTGSNAGQVWVTAGGTDIVNGARADTNSTQRAALTTIAAYVHAGGSLTVAHSFLMISNIGTVWNGPSTALDVFYLGPS